VNAEQATASALRLLKARPRTRHEVDVALETRGCEPGVRAAVLEKLAGWGYLDDTRFAARRAAALLRDGQGPLGVLRRLETHGIDETAARAALADAEAELGGTTEDRARALLARRRASGAKAARLLASRGYPESVIEALRLDAPPEDE
jgi:regulatory protein